MNAQFLNKLAQQGALEQLPSGQPGVRVSLQYETRLTIPSRAQRRAILHDEFARIAQAIDPLGAQVNLDSVSVSGQTIEAILPLERYEMIANDLHQQHIRVDPLIERKVV